MTSLVARGPIADTARVFLNRRGEMHTMWPSEGLRRLDSFLQGWRSYYTVDIGEHSLELSLNLPSTNDALKFRCDVRLLWKVHEPGRIVAASIHDVRTRLGMEMERRARPVTWEFHPPQSREVEQRLNEVLGAAAPARLDIGITIWNVYVRVDPPDLRRVNIEQDEQQKFEIGRIDRRYSFYRDRFAEGHEALLALSIQDQSDVGMVVNMLLEHGNQRAARSLEAFKAMVQEGRVEDFELDGIRKATLENMIDLLQYRLGGAASIPPPPPPKMDGSLPAPQSSGADGDGRRW